MYQWAVFYMTSFHLITHSPQHLTATFLFTLSLFFFMLVGDQYLFLQKHLQCLDYTTGGHVTLTRPLDNSFWDMSRIREGTVSKNWSAPSHKHAVWSGNQTSMLSFWANPKACLDILSMFPPQPICLQRVQCWSKNGSLWSCVCVCVPSVLLLRPVSLCSPEYYSQSLLETYSPSAGPPPPLVLRNNPSFCLTVYLWQKKKPNSDVLMLKSSISDFLLCVILVENSSWKEMKP